MFICLWLRMQSSLLPLIIYLLVKVQDNPQNRTWRTSISYHQLLGTSLHLGAKVTDTKATQNIASSNFHSYDSRYEKEEEEREGEVRATFWSRELFRALPRFLESTSPSLHTHKSLSYNSQKCGINSLCLHECLVFEIESISASLSGTWHHLAWAT